MSTHFEEEKARQLAALAERTDATRRRTKLAHYMLASHLEDAIKYLLSEMLTDRLNPYDVEEHHERLVALLAQYTSACKMRVEPEPARKSETEPVNTQVS